MIMDQQCGQDSGDKEFYFRNPFIIKETQIVIQHE
jgi:hypothetical protein